VYISIYDKNRRGREREREEKRETGKERLAHTEKTCRLER